MARRMKRILFAALLVILSLPAIPWASSGATLFSLLGFDSIREMMPEGRFVVYVSKGDKWQEAGNLSFNRNFVEKELDLSKHLLGNDRTKIRLVQKGGGASHIDSVFLGGMPPTEIMGAQDDRELKKLSRKDFDVIDAFGREMELSFPRGKDGVLRLAARVEGTRIGEVPFQFPLENLCESMSERSAFYTYRMVKDRPGDQPFFKEYSVTGSGHPSGYTYGWVWNDDQNLYVRIDFTPDDTMDGDKDYAKVYVNTEGGVREFKVSESETTWGRPDFRYTDKVVYEHKVYDFKIPLKEIGLRRTEEEKELLLAFAAYGTAAVQITSVPTLNDWGIITLIVLLGIGATYCLIPRSRLLRQ